MPEEFEDVFETLELLKDEAFDVERNAETCQRGGHKPNLEWYATKVQAMKALVRTLEGEILSIALNYEHATR